jgi:NAD(P)-dependent dehydrogenase (short-subunit alcohol dehydrogenase family)
MKIMSQFPLPNASQDLTGQVALVTGATSGLGWRFAQVLASAGATVALTGRREANLKALHKEITDSGGSSAWFALDMTDAENIVQTVADAEDALGPISILVNNAGIPDAQLAMQMEVELIDRVLSTNLRGPFILSCEVGRRMKAHKIPGRIVSISSSSAFNYTGMGAALYSTTKAAISRMTETLAVEWARFNINVNAIAPGAFSSEMMDGMLERVGDITEFFPRKRLGQPAQLDSTLLFLCSPASECVTGTIVRVDDGQDPR